MDGLLSLLDFAQSIILLKQDSKIPRHVEILVMVFVSLLVAILSYSVIEVVNNGKDIYLLILPIVLVLLVLSWWIKLITILFKSKNEKEL